MCEAFGGMRMIGEQMKQADSLSLLSILHQNSLSPFLPFASLAYTYGVCVCVCALVPEVSSGERVGKRVGTICGVVCVRLMTVNERTTTTTKTTMRRPSSLLSHSVCLLFSVCQR